MSNGFHHLKAWLPPAAVGEFIEGARIVCLDAPLLQPTMPDGTPLSVKVASAGACGWWADRKGYRYVDKHPKTGKPFPAIPANLAAYALGALTAVGLPPMRLDTMLINFYDDLAKLGLHVDRTEDDRTAPIVSFSVGADAVFLMGTWDKAGKTTQHILSTGDLVIQSGDSRQSFHGIKKLLPTMPNPLKHGGRLNFTFRKVRA